MEVEEETGRTKELNEMALVGSSVWLVRRFSLSWSDTNPRKLNILSGNGEMIDELNWSLPQPMTNPRFSANATSTQRSLIITIDEACEATTNVTAHHPSPKHSSLSRLPVENSPLIINSNDFWVSHTNYPRTRAFPIVRKALRVEAINNVRLCFFALLSAALSSWKIHNVSDLFSPVWWSYENHFGGSSIQSMHVFGVIKIAANNKLLHEARSYVNFLK